MIHVRATLNRLINRLHICIFYIYAIIIIIIKEEVMSLRGKGGDMEGVEESLRL